MRIQANGASMLTMKRQTMMMSTAQDLRAVTIPTQTIRLYGVTKLKISIKNYKYEINYKTTTPHDSPCHDRGNKCHSWDKYLAEV